MNGLKELVGKPTSWILALALLILVAQNAGILGRVADVFGGGEGNAQASRDLLIQHAETTKQQNQQMIDNQQRMISNQEFQRQTTATGLRVLCLTQAKTDQQRFECGKIQ